MFLKKGFYGTIDELAARTEWVNSDSMSVSCHGRTLDWNIEGPEDIFGGCINGGPFS
jgi:hypothetical protein